MSDFDDFGPREPLGLPQPFDGSNLPMEVEDRTLADVIVESFDSLTTTFDEFSKNIKPLDKRDVYEASKNAIKDSGLLNKSTFGPSGGGNITIKESSDLPEIKEYWRIKTQRELESIAKKEESEIKQREEQIKKETESRIEGFFKWTQQAVNSPVAFLEDFAIKKILEPFVTKLASDDNQNTNKNSNAGINPNVNNIPLSSNNTSTNTQTIPQFAQNAVSGITISQLDEVLKRDLSIFGEGILIGIDRILSNRGFGAGGTSDISSAFTSARSGSSTGISPLMSNSSRVTPNTSIHSSIISTESTKTTALLESPRNSEFMETIDEIVNEHETKGSKKDEKEKDEEKAKEKESGLSKVFSPVTMAILKMLGVFALVTTAVRIINNIADNISPISDFFKKLLGKGGYKGPNESDLPTGELLTNSGVLAIDKVGEDSFNNAWSEAVTDLDSNDSIKSIANRKIVPMSSGVNFIPDKATADFKLSNDDFVSLTNDAVSELSEKERNNLFEISESKLSDPNSKNSIIGSNGRIKPTSYDEVFGNKDIKGGFENNKNLKKAIVKAFRRKYPDAKDVTDSQIWNLYKNSLIDAATWNGIEGSAVRFNSKSNSFESYSTDVSGVDYSAFNEAELRNLIYNTSKTNTRDSLNTWYDSYDNWLAQPHPDSEDTSRANAEFQQQYERILMQSRNFGENIISIYNGKVNEDNSISQGSN